jgi:hypothetical protein
MEIAAYYFPNYHYDARNRLVHGENWNEWELIKNQNDKKIENCRIAAPLWGYEDESDPLVMGKKIAAAANAGISAFIFDWYYYEDGLFLEKALEDGFMRAPNRNSIKFSLMWANHDWLDMHPAVKISDEQKVLYPGKVSPEAFAEMTSYVIDKYFPQDNYWQIDACPYFSIYELGKFIESMGGIDEAAAAIREFRTKVKRAGFKDLHLNAIYFQVPVLQNEKSIEHPSEVINRLGFDSLTSYAWVHHHELTENFSPASRIMEKYLRTWDEFDAAFSVPYYPNISVAWNNNPRYTKDFTKVMTNTPEDFKQMLITMKNKLRSRKDGLRILGINAWNEWTEGSYLEPDNKNNYAYLNAVKEVFASADRSSLYGQISQSVAV